MARAEKNNELESLKTNGDYPFRVAATGPSGGFS